MNDMLDSLLVKRGVGLGVGSGKIGNKPGYQQFSTTEEQIVHKI